MSKDNTPSTLDPPHRRSINSLSSGETQTHNNTHSPRRASGDLDKMSEKDRKSITASSTPDPATEPNVEKAVPQGPAFSKEAEENYKPKTFKFWSIMLSAFIAMFLVALDRTIISTAIPQITNDFHSLGDIGWYGSAYMITTAAFQLVFGRIYRFYDLRWTFLVCILLFEVGSTICGAAPNSVAFIVGRAIAGAGSAGITTGSMMTIIPMIPLHKRPMYQSMFGLVFGIASVTGPLIGGALTVKATWRWCFYMNLPVGGIAAVCLFFFLKSPEKQQESVPAIKHLTRLDPLGTFFFVPSMVCLILALEWGGSTYAWGSWRIIVLFVVFALTIIAFCAVQVLMPKTATVPLRIVKQRSMIAAFCYMFLVAGSMMIVVYYVPLWFQTTKNIDPLKSGIYTIPLVLSLVVASICSAIFTQRIGYYVPAMLICPCVMAIGEGLLSTFKPDTNSSHWIAYQFLTGFGLGLGMQTAGLSVQAILPKEDISTGMAIMFFCQQLGGAVFVSVGQTILSSLLVKKLSGIAGLDPKTIVRTGATDLHDIVPAEYFGKVINAYNYACTRIFLAAMGISLGGLFCAMFMKWVSIKKPKQGPPAPAGETAKAEGEKEEKKEEK